MDSLESMRIFVRVIEAGSYTAAADSLDSNVSAMSRAVSVLETRLRTRLLNRTTRCLALTDAGERYLQRCTQILADIDSAEEEASCAHERPSGLLRMHSLASIGQQYVLPAISCYRALYPDVTVELTLSQRIPNFFEGSSDVSIMMATSLPDSELVSHQLGSSFGILCASPAYVCARGSPCTPAELSHHDCLILRTPAYPAHEWVLDGPEGSVKIKVNGSIRINIAEALAAAIAEGMGIGMLPVYAAIDGLKNGTLVRILPQYTLQRSGVYALYPSRRFIDAKTKTWVKFLRNYFPEVIARDLSLLEKLTQAQLDNEKHVVTKLD